MLRDVMEDVMRRLHNYFLSPRGTTPTRQAEYVVRNGELTVSGNPLGDWLQPNQYYWVAGSVFSNGLHRFGDPDDLLADETFAGAVSALSIPPDFIRACRAIEAYDAKQEASGGERFISETFGGYTYRRPTTSTGTVQGGVDVYADRLNRWRKVSDVFN